MTILEPSGPICADCSCLSQVLPWSANEDVLCTATEDEKTLARAEATEILHALSGRQFGLHSFRFMPCRQHCCANPCGSDGCSSCSYHRLSLPHFDVCQIERVVFDCVAQDLNNYKLHRDQHARPYLVKVDGTPWPTEQCLAEGFSWCEDGNNTTPADTFSWWIEYTHGITPPLIADQAVATLACELIKAKSADDTCRLPEGVQSVVRQGVSYVIDPYPFITNGMIGISSIDRFLRAVNPSGLQRSATVINPRKTPYVTTDY